jgi:ABC-type Fe3+ transport system permease subunit
MVKSNLVIAIIVICLFVALAIVGFAIYAVQNNTGMSLFTKKTTIIDEEE